MIFCTNEVILLPALLKHSKQREAILSMLRSRYDHPTAEQLYTDLKKEYPKISLGTVYRNLALFESLGEIMKISTSGESDRFDGNANNHYHFECKECNCVFDIDIPLQVALNDTVAQAMNAEIYNHSLIFYGICKNCRKLLD